MVQCTNRGSLFSGHMHAAWQDTAGESLHPDSNLVDIAVAGHEYRVYTSDICYC